ncbi:hypothetical protein [Legionella maioricensis]|uniref:Coiled-coil protein n=1 Tax=Legionella maioricensis TaxID=2896528 RepID=A0A9X2CZX4_9GAMM|nr:hypothetical protein [Legionella maioricensis]MCL9683792.1 hypothetical protein [Legionella maioricensis]MCL9686639.1 hypothetical protein [Legionella maioricensis]
MSMGVEVVLSTRSQELIAKYLSLCQPHASRLAHFYSPIDSIQLISWLHDEITQPPNTDTRVKKEIEFILASLRAELLRDLLTSMGGELPENNAEENSTWVAKIKVGLLALAGTLLAGCEGFDSITTMLSVLSLPSMFILIAGLGFSILSILVFYGFDLVQVSKNLGVTLRDAPKLLDVYLLQMKEIKGIRRRINTYKFAELSAEELTQLENMITMLQRRFQELTEASSQFETALNSRKMQIAKLIASSTAGLLFFGSGFFAGQSVAMFIAGLFIPAVLPTFWPVVLFSVIVGIAAFTLYWYIEQAGFKKLVSGWFGLDEDKIEQLCDKEHLDKEEKKLENLKEQVSSTAQLANRLVKLQNKLDGIDATESEQVVTSVPNVSTAPVRISDNIYSFHPKKDVARKIDTSDSEEILLFECK